MKSMMEKALKTIPIAAEDAIYSFYDLLADRCVDEWVIVSKLLLIAIIPTILVISAYAMAIGLPCLIFYNKIIINTSIQHIYASDILQFTVLVFASIGLMGSSAVAYSDVMSYSYSNITRPIFYRFMNSCVKDMRFERKFIFLPRHCHITGKSLFFKYAWQPTITAEMPDDKKRVKKSPHLMSDDGVMFWICSN